MTDARLNGGSSNRRAAGARPPWSAGAARIHARPWWCADRAPAHADGRCFWNSGRRAAGYRRRAAPGETARR